MRPTSLMGKRSIKPEGCPGREHRLKCNPMWFCEEATMKVHAKRAFRSVTEWRVTTISHNNDPYINHKN